MPKCLKLGWFLPYVPEKNEYGAWKRYYIACATSLEYLTPRTPLVISKQKIEEQEERWQAKCLQKFIRGGLAVRKSQFWFSY